MKENLGIQPSKCPQCNKLAKEDVPFCERCNFDLRYGVLDRGKASKCIHCKKREILSDEHIFPDWLSKKYPRRNKRTSHRLNRPSHHRFGEKPKIYSVASVRQGDPYITKVSNVCKSCNNGWMSDLQNQAKGMIECLAEGEWPNLIEGDCNILSRWVAMVSINFQCYARILNATVHQRETLMSGSMPSGWRVSIGSMKTTESAGHSFHRSIQVPFQIKEDEFLRIDSTYFCIEHVAFHALSSICDQLLDLGMKYGVGNFSLPTREVWPFNSCADQSAGCGLTGDDLVAIQRQLDS
ncbi:hypothetical protein NB689_002095 [Xanthomonas sacchari]|uniref:hypothetical protein n=1 Tax=Xanthomonas sacchari TaxID=56458 RepID=UPI002252E4E4|nr:hypothetical protein [Xanthomonas sacchari]MCW0405535.1 hypothetical protein [Xanthomonas sacchari]MCW0416341.1 hypothetical protein [Xanthomonas sacchari]